MSIVVEDGTARADAQAFCDVSFLDKYFSDRGSDLTDLSATQADKEKALIRAADYLSTYYHDDWKGYRISQTQALDFPRGGVMIDLGTTGSTVWGYSASFGQRFLLASSGAASIPDMLKFANCELALRSLKNGSGKAAEIAPDIAPGEAGVVQDTLGPISTQWRGGGSNPVAVFRRVEMLLNPLLSYGSGGAELVRG